jgi:hypothetical protein
MKFTPRRERGSNTIQVYAWKGVAAVQVISRGCFRTETDVRQKSVRTFSIGKSAILTRLTSVTQLVRTTRRSRCDLAITTF